MRLASTDPERRADRSGPRPSRPLLLPGLAASSGDRGSVFRRPGASPLFRQLPGDDSVEDIGPGGEAEDVGWQREGCPWDAESRRRVDERGGEGRERCFCRPLGRRRRGGKGQRRKRLPAVMIERGALAARVAAARDRGDPGGRATAAEAFDCCQREGRGRASSDSREQGAASGRCGGGHRSNESLSSLSELSLSFCVSLSFCDEERRAGACAFSSGDGIRNSNALSSSSSSSFSFESKKKKEWRAQLKASRTFFFSFDHRNFFTLRLFQPSVPLPFLPPLLHT